MDKKKIIKYGKTAGIVAELVPMVALRVVKTQKARMAWSAVSLGGAITYLAFTVIEMVDEIKETKN